MRSSLWIQPLVTVSVAFILSLLLILMLMKWSYLSDSEGVESDSGSIKWLPFPTNLQELRDLAAKLSSLWESHSFYVLLVFSSIYLFKQTFAIPGSVFMNLLGGRLFGLYCGFPLCCLLTATGATFCYLLSYCSGMRSLLSHLMPSKMSYLESRVCTAKIEGRLIYFLISARLFPMTPNWFLNFASPLVGVPIHYFFTSVLLGLMPFNFICVQTGSLLGEIGNVNDMVSWGTSMKLACVALVALLPSVLLRAEKSKHS